MPAREALSHTMYVRWRKDEILWHINLSNQAYLFKKNPDTCLWLSKIITSLENHEKLWDPIMNLEKLLWLLEEVPAWQQLLLWWRGVLEGTCRYISTIYSTCVVLYLDVVRITSGCISNVKVGEVKNHHFGSCLGDDPLTGLWVRGHPGVIRWMDCACSRQGTSTGCQETPRISTCDEWFQGMYHNDVWYVSSNTTKLE